MVRMDYAWEDMVEADGSGKFLFPSTAPGKHRLTVYLPLNLRGDQGIGHTDVTVEQGKRVDNAIIQLETLAEARVRMIDAQGNPLSGITAGATWSKDGNGFWTQGTDSGADGWAVLYLYPGSEQYIRGLRQQGQER